MAEDEMIERVAKAIASAIVAQNHMLELDEDGCGYFDDYDNKDYDCRPVAVAAIAAMREPTKEMIDPGYHAMDENVDFYNYDSGAGYSIEPTGPANVWRAMIDAVLPKPPK